MAFVSLLQNPFMGVKELFSVRLKVERKRSTLGVVSHALPV